MKEITEFINTFLGAPLQLLIILFTFGIFLYWYIKVRPKEQEHYQKVYQDFIKKSEQSDRNAKEEREKFFKILEDHRVQNERISALYDKALDNSTRAIENNTAVIHSYNAHIQVNNQTLETLNRTIESYSDELKNLEHSHNELNNSVHEAVALQQVIINKRG